MKVSACWALMALIAVPTILRPATAQDEASNSIDESDDTISVQDGTPEEPTEQLDDSPGDPKTQEEAQKLAELFKNLSPACAQELQEAYSEVRISCD